MANICFKGAGYTGELDTVFITTFLIGPLPPRARLFDREVVVRECRNFQQVARAFLVNQEWLRVPEDPQELIPEIAPAVEEAKEPERFIEILIWESNFVVRDGGLMFRAEIRSSKKLPTRARKLVGDTLSKSLKNLVGLIERKGGCPGDIIQASELTAQEPAKEAPLPMNTEIPEIP